MKSGTKGRVSTKRGEGGKNMEAASDCWKKGAHAPCNMCGWWRQVFNGQRPAAAPFPPRRAPSPRRRHSAQRVATTTAPSRPTGPCTVVTSALPHQGLPFSLSLSLPSPPPDHSPSSGRISCRLSSPAPPLLLLLPPERTCHCSSKSPEEQGRV